MAIFPEWIDSEDFWKALEREHFHINRDYVLRIMRSLNAMGYLTAEGRKALEKLIIEDGKK